jgi:cytoskeletal protein CcmA (bactofilin family)
MEKEMTDNIKQVQTDNESDEAQTIFADDVTFNGDLNTEKDVTVYGTYTGSLTCRTLNVATTGAVHGDIDAETIKVSGRVDGKVTANNLMVSKTGGIEGEYECLRFGIEPGAAIKASKLNCVEEIGQNIQNPSVRRHPRVVISGASGMPMGAESKKNEARQPLASKTNTSKSKETASS